MAPKKKEKEPDLDPSAAARAYVNPTPKGECKSMSEPMEPSYKPHAVEASWNDWWEASGYYLASSDPEDNRPKFSICLPPPNVTGALHLGHALTVAVQDLLCRWHRMRGYNVLWIPGTDHAGIATQVVVEKLLKKSGQPNRHEMGREAFVAKVYEWKDKYGNKIYSQMRRMGCSLDWSREVFTMDPPRARSVQAAFLQFHKDKVIYRDVRLTNWCCALQSVISNLEVDQEPITKRTKRKVPGHKFDSYVFGVIWSFAYKVEGSDEEVVVATTRPETMLGDTAVAVHPDDPRYKQLHGRFLVHPFVPRKIPIVTDAVLVDMSFGTGAVKVTPAHDPNDFKCGRRNGLEEITIFTDEGQMASNCGQFAGMMRFDARVAVLKALKDLGLFRGEQDNAMTIPICSRTGDIIEPVLKPQWWVDCTGMAKRAADAVRNGELTILPKEAEKVWFHFLDNIQDWCVSRQLWWGHRIPAYFAKVDGVDVGVHVAATEAEALEAALKEHGCRPEQLTLTQDEDVLDTWFSSGLFPFSCLGWPDQSSADLQAWHPTSLLETGQDILFFWVARMVMCSLQLTNKLPFTTVYLHSMVRDKYGRKMSKSLGNVIDPLEVIEGVSLEALCAKLREGNLAEAEVAKAEEMNQKEYPQGIPECGSDALRFGLLAHVGVGRDINLDVQAVAGYSKFCNKLWNATRFAFLYLGTDGAIFTPLPLSAELGALPDKWILSKLVKTVETMDKLLKDYQIALAAEAIYAFWYNCLCDVYLEAIKPVMQLDSTEPANAATKHATQTVLHACLSYGLRLLHPFMPMVTEELYHRLALLCGQPRSTVMLAKYPEPADAVGALRSAAAEETMETLMKIGGAIRALRALYLKGALEKHAPLIYVVCRQPSVAALVVSQNDTLCSLARSSKSPAPEAIKVVPDGEAPPAGCAMEVLDRDTEVHIFLKGVVDFSKEVQRLKKEIASVQGFLDKVLKKVAAPSYYEKCPQATIDEDAAKIEGYKSELITLQKACDAFAVEVA